MLVEVMIIFRTFFSCLQDDFRKLRLRQSGFHTRACICGLIREVFANTDKNTWLLVIMVGIEEN